MSSVGRRVVIVGAGHNGLITAWYLAKAGFGPLVLERREVLGGAAITEELFPGFRCPTLAHLPGPLLPHIARDLKLAERHLSITNHDVRLLALNTQGRAIRIYDDPIRTAKDLETVSAHDAAAYPKFHAVLGQIGRTLAPLLSTTPPEIDALKISDYFGLGKLALKFRAMDRKNAYRLLRWIPMAVADLVSTWFETDLLQAAIAARGIYGSYAGPRSAGTSVGLLLQAAIDGQPVIGASFVSGGIGTLTQTLASAASEAGAKIRTSAAVARVITKDGGVTAVALESGETIPASAVVSSADPQHTFLELVDPFELDPSFLRKIRNYRCVGIAAKVNLALSGMPAFRELAPRIHIGPGIEYLERAFDEAKYGNFSPAPYMDITIPSLVDPSLAPRGSHVMSIYVQYAPYHLRNGDWNSRREEFADAVIRTLSAYAPNLCELIVHRQVITPLDLKQTYGLTGGHIFHGEHSLDQLYPFRPVIGWSQYRTPIRDLYLCGAGTHPGGGLTGAPAANASREIIRSLRNGARRPGNDA